MWSSAILLIESLPDDVADRSFIERTVLPAVRSAARPRRCHLSWLHADAPSAELRGLCTIGAGKPFSLRVHGGSESATAAADAAGGCIEMGWAKTDVEDTVSLGAHLFVRLMAAVCHSYAISTMTSHDRRRIDVEAEEAVLARHIAAAPAELVSTEAVRQAVTAAADGRLLLISGRRAVGKSATVAKLVSELRGDGSTVMFAFIRPGVSLRVALGRLSCELLEYARCHDTSLWHAAQSGDVTSAFQKAVLAAAGATAPTHGADSSAQSRLVVVLDGVPDHAVRDVCNAFALPATATLSSNHIQRGVLGT